MTSPLWLCIHLHRLKLDTVTRSQPDGGSLAVSETRGSQRWISDASDALLEAGLSPGMGLAAAYALVPDLQVFPRQPGAEQRALKQAAAWAYRISSQVSLQPPDMLLAEISGSLKLLGQQGPWQQVIADGLSQLGYQTRFCVAPTPAAARTLARAGQYRVLATRRRLMSQLADIALSASEIPPAAQRTLTSMGVHTLGALLALPRDGLLRRFGQPLLDTLDRLTGRLPEALDRYEPPARFSSRIELAADVEDAEGLLFAARRLLDELAQFLVLRDQAVSEFMLGLEHAHGDTRWLRIGLLEPQRDPQQLLALLRERLNYIQLKAPVRQVLLNAPQLQGHVAQADDLFEAAAPLKELSRLLERLRSRLGSDGVQGLSEYPDHRPERASRAWPVNEPAPQLNTCVGPRPVWLIEPPRPLRQAPQPLLSGPERMESGWWDGQDVQRDYYVAEDRPGRLLWVYQERTTQDWYLHGLFS